MHETAVQRWARWLLPALLLAAFALRLHELTRQDIWWDEARNIDVALRPFLQVAVAPELDIHPPVYFWLLHAWTQLTGLQMGQEPAALAYVTRFLNVLAGVVGTALLYPLGARIGGRIGGHVGGPAAGLCAVTLGALSPFWLAESQETRMYTLGFALLSAAALALMRATQGEGRGARGEERGAGSGERGMAGAFANHPVSQSPNLPFLSCYRFHIAFVILCALALLTHYNAVFIVVAWYLWWGAWALLQPARGRELATVIISGLVMTLLVLPVTPIALRQIPGYANPNLRVPTVLQYLGENARAYFGGYAFDPALLWNNATLWLWLSLALVLVGLALRMRQGRLKDFSLLLVWLAGGLALYYIAVLDRGAFNVRYSSFVTPALYGLTGAALAAWGALWRPLPAVGVALLLAGLLPGIRADFYDDRFAREDIAGVTAWLREEAGPDAVIFVDQKFPFGFYYDRYVIDEGETPQGEEAAPARYLFVDINAIDERLNQWAADAEAVYWVQWFESDTDPRRSVPFLLDKEGAHVGEKRFQGYVVDWWELTPPNRFELGRNFVAVRHAWPPAVQTVEIALPDGSLAPGETAFVAVRWQRAGTEPVGRPLKARVALYDAADGRRAQADERILNDRHLMPDEWSATDQPLNVYRVQTPPDIEPGTYTLRLLVYDADSLEPLGLVDEAANPVGVEAEIGTLTIVDGQ